jgi:hypothetical protein
MANDDWNEMVELYKRDDETSSMKIIRQESRETVLVNALVYFLHPRRGGDDVENTILKNLLKKADFACPPEPRELLCIKTEFPCENGGRLDILLEFQNHCIGLEVKIDSDVNNDFKNYRESVETRANAGGRSRKVKNFLLVKERKKGKAIEKLKNEHESKGGDWGVISWGELMKGCLRNKGTQEKSSGIDDLLETLKKIETNSLSKLEEFTKKNKLDESAKDLEKFLQKNKDQFSAKKIYVWDSVDDLRQIYEPRVVVEFDSLNNVKFDSLNNVKVDVCVGFRGTQFVVFNKLNSYDRTLYEIVSNNYRFYYWQDYQDEIEHYNRYLLANENPVCEDGNGPILPDYDEFTCSAGEEDSILVKHDMDGANFCEEVVKKLVEIRDKLVK